MCGRYVSAAPPDELARYFDAEATEAVLEPSYNVAPTNQVYVVYETGGVRKLDTMKWGLVPFWAKDPKIGNRMINARSEGIETKNAYRSAFKKKRCIIPADGFYEWKQIPGQKKKQPNYITRPDGEPFAFAGLWEVWRPKDTEAAEKDGLPTELHTCTIITTSANEKMSELHDRMPVMLPPEQWQTWLDEENSDTELLGKLLVPAPNQLIQYHPVSTAVNNPRSRGAELVEEDPGELTILGEAAADGGE